MVCVSSHIIVLFVVRMCAWMHVFLRKKKQSNTCRLLWQGWILVSPFCQDRWQMCAEMCHLQLINEAVAGQATSEASCRNSIIVVISTVNASLWVWCNCFQISPPDVSGSKFSQHLHKYTQIYRWNVLHFTSIIYLHEINMHNVRVLRSTPLPWLPKAEAH